jgi:hypothetical protein
MRIISDFHDYYDAVQATGQDQTLIYVRRMEEAKISEYPFPVLTYQYYISNDENRVPRVQQHIVGFCGKIYPVLVLTHVATDNRAVCFDLNEVDSFVERNFPTNAAMEYKRPLRRRWRYWPGSLRDEIEKYFAACAAKKNSFSEMFLEKGCPLFIATTERRGWRVRDAKIVYNGVLKELEFFRLFDTYTTFQEIAMYLGGLAVPFKDIPHVPDKVMVGVKGFDKWSFRKPPMPDSK